MEQPRSNLGAILIGWGALLPPRQPDQWRILDDDLENKQITRKYGSKCTLNASRKHYQENKAHIFASFNNTIVTVTDQQGNTICWGSSGSAGFKGSRKSTPFAARLAAEQAIKAAQNMGVQEVDMIIKGPGPGRESAIRAVQSLGLKVRSIADITPVPHNGCRPPKKRRV